MWGMALAVGLASPGCIAPPERDVHWGGSSGQDSALYSKSRHKKARSNATLALVFGYMCAGVAAVLAVVTPFTCTGDHPSDCRATVAVGLSAGAVTSLLLPCGYYQKSVADRWLGAMRGSPAAPGVPGGFGALPEGPALPGGPREPASAACESRAPPGLLYLPTGEPFPAGGERHAVIRVSGPGDPVVARLVARTPILRWPVLAVPRADGGEDLAVGEEARAALAESGARRLE